jgi:hypothetical protein
LETEVALPRGTIDRVLIHIPPGHAGLTGLALEYSHEHIYPWGAGSWLEGDDQVVVVPLDFATGGSPVVVRTYNTDDTFDHDHLLLFDVLDPVGPLPAPLRPLAIAPSDLGIPIAGSSDEDVPNVGDATTEEGEPIGELVES